MGIKDLDALAKTIKPFRQENCQSVVLNTWGDNGAQSSSAVPVESSTVDHQTNNNRHRQRRPDRAVYVPRGRRSQTTPPTPATASNPINVKSKEFEKESVNVISVSNSTNESAECSETVETNPQEPVIKIKEKELKLDQVVKPVADAQQENFKHQINSQSIVTSTCLEKSSHLPKNTETITSMDETNVNKDVSKIEMALNSNNKDYNEEKEFQKASKEINRRNRRIIKQTFDSNVLEISETPSVTSKQLLPTTTTTTKTSTESNVAKKSHLPQTDTQSTANAPAKLSKKSNEKMAVSGETDDWESMFDDNGECLDPKLMNEITANVGKVTITKPKNDYKTYQEPVNLDDEEFPHVLEVSNFPVEFKTQDLMMIFSEYKDSGYDIKWVDDTHALVVFSSSKIAARALNSGHSFVKLKPLTQATAESKAKAKKSSLFLQPYRQRPETCAALARRLVTGALGVRLSTAREEREIERRVLKEAKERKLLAAKLRDEAWED